MITFGQIRKITFYAPVEKLYNDKVNVAIFSVDSDEADIEFEIESEKGSYTDVCKFRIYGVSRESYNTLFSYLEADKSVPVEVLAGYKTNNYNSNVFVGNIIGLEYDFNSGDPRMVCTLNQNSDKMYYKYFEKTYAKDTDRRYIVGDVINEAGYIQKNIYIPDEFNTIYRKGLTVKGSAKEILDKIANDANMKYFFDDRYVSVVPKSYSKGSEVIPLDFSSGLITIPEKDEKNIYSFKMFLNHRIKSDVLLMLITDNTGRILPVHSIEGTMNYYKVVKFKHTAGGINEFETYVECEKSSIDEEEAKNFWDQFYREYWEEYIVT